MDPIFVIIIVVVVLAVLAKVAFWLFVGFFAVRAAKNYGAQLDREMLLFQQQLQQAAAVGGNASQAINPQLVAQWNQMSQLYGSMGSQDQMRYDETMASMRADAASVGLFLD